MVQIINQRHQNPAPARPHVPPVHNVPVLNQQPQPVGPQAVIVQYAPARRQRRDPPYVEQPEEVERSIIRKSNAGNYVKIYLLSPELDEFLIRKRCIRRSRSYDFQRHLDILQSEIRSNPDFLPAPYSETKLRDVVNARNELDHNDWHMLNVNNDHNLESMMDLADALDKPRVANEMLEIGNAITAGDFCGGVSFIPFRFPSSGAYDRFAGLGLNQITNAVMSTYLVKAIWRFRNNRLPIGSLPPSLDIYANSLDLIKIQKRNPNYLGRRGLTMLLLLKELRLDIAHGHYEKLFHEFEDMYDNLERLLRALGDIRAADEVALIRDLLIACKYSRKEVIPKYFPGLFH